MPPCVRILHVLQRRTGMPPSSLACSLRGPSHHLACCVRESGGPDVRSRHRRSLASTSSHSPRRVGDCDGTLFRRIVCLVVGHGDGLVERSLPRVLHRWSSTERCVACTRLRRTARRRSHCATSPRSIGTAQRICSRSDDGGTYHCAICFRGVSPST